MIDKSLDFYNLTKTVSDILSVNWKSKAQIRGLHEKGTESVSFFVGQHTMPLISSRATYKSIEHLISMNHFSDAFVLIRKLRDDLFQYLFLEFVLESNYKCYDKTIVPKWECKEWGRKGL
jgi:hypothetical protein